MPPLRWIEPQLAKLSTKAPSGAQWIHEIKFDGYRMAAQIDQGEVKLLTRSGLDWMAKYPATVASFAKLKVKSAYIDGELCGLRPDGVTSFELTQTASDRGGDGLMFFAFDLIEFEGEAIARLPLGERKQLLKALLGDPPDGIAFSDHEGGDGEVFRQVKTKCLNRAEFVVVGWSEPEGSRPYVGALLLCTFEPDGRLVYAGRVGTGMSQKTLAMLHKRLKLLAVKTMPLAAPPPRDSRFGRPLELAKAHWIRPELVAEITYLSWPEDGLLRHTVYVGLREDKPGREVRREKPGS